MLNVSTNDVFFLKHFIFYSEELEIQWKAHEIKKFNDKVYIFQKVLALTFGKLLLTKVHNITLNK